MINMNNEHLYDGDDIKAKDEDVPKYLLIGKEYDFSGLETADCNAWRYIEKYLYSEEELNDCKKSAGFGTLYIEHLYELKQII